MEAENNLQGEHSEDERMPASNTPLDQQMERMQGEIIRLQESMERANAETASELVRLQTHQLDQEVELKSRKRGSGLLGSA